MFDEGFAPVAHEVHDYNIFRLRENVGPIVDSGEISWLDFVYVKRGEKASKRFFEPSKSMFEEGFST